MQGKSRPNNPSADETKRAAILNAAMAEFASGYERASTDAIVKAAGVSKGLLFHYFGSKKELFLFAYEYALKTVIAQVYDLIRWEERDLLNRYQQIALLKMDLMKQHPLIFDFIARASFFEHQEITEKIAQLQDKLKNELYPKLLSDIDHSLFREDIDAGAAMSAMIYTIEGYARNEADATKSMREYYDEYDRYLRDLERFCKLFRTTFYKQGGSPCASSTSKD